MSSNNQSESWRLHKLASYYRHHGDLIAATRYEKKLTWIQAHSDIPLAGPAADSTCKQNHRKVIFIGLTFVLWISSLVLGGLVSDFVALIFFITGMAFLSFISWRR